MNYIDEIAKAIGEKCDWALNDIDNDGYNELLRLYAFLCLLRGTETTQKDVHDAWSAWTACHDPKHRSLIPFEELTKEVQELDQPYVDAIHEVARLNSPPPSAKV